ncbi:leu operon leader peptide [Siccibacter turicensis]|uniref:Leu operon leader peptide n=1 Tax=Siccibacter turicensis TaxID=357233 RepID=A0A2P8VH75_9ENTR|nr:leu operon leader peptide [Siccibacter turicensis]
MFITVRLLGLLLNAFTARGRLLGDNQH